MNKLPTLKIGTIHIKIQVSMISWKTGSGGFELPVPQGNSEQGMDLAALWAGLCALCIGLHSAIFPGSHFFLAPQRIWVCSP